MDREEREGKEGRGVAVPAVYTTSLGPLPQNELDYALT